MNARAARRSGFRPQASSDDELPGDRKGDIHPISCKRLFRNHLNRFFRRVGDGQDAADLCKISGLRMVRTTRFSAERSPPCCFRPCCLIPMVWSLNK